MSYGRYHAILGPIHIKVTRPGGSLDANRIKQDMNIGPRFMNIRRWKVVSGVE